jgi:hypothetical protein
MKAGYSPLLLTFLLLAICSGTQCHKAYKFVPDNPYGLPNINEEGTMGCLINTKTWIASADAISGLFSILYTDHFIKMHGRRNGTYAEEIDIEVNLSNPQFKVGVPMPVDSINTLISYDADSTCTGPIAGLLGGLAVSGTVTVTQLDTLKNLFSGTFTCVIPLPVCDTLQLTSGRFSEDFSRQ